MPERGAGFTTISLLPRSNGATLATYVLAQPGARRSEPMRSPTTIALRQRIMLNLVSRRFLGGAHGLDAAEQGVVFLAGADRDSQFVGQWGFVEMADEDALAFQAVVHGLAFAVGDFREEEIRVA